MVEYSLVVATIVVAAIGGFSALQAAETNYFTGFGAALQPTPIPCGASCTTLRSYSTTLSCAASSLFVSNPDVCTVTIQDTSSSPVTPTGTFNWASSSTGQWSAGSGTFSAGPPPSCTLTTVSSSSASCSVTYKPSVIGSHTLTATYNITPQLAGTIATQTITATGRATTVSIPSCTLNPVPANVATTCTVNVSNATAGGTPPTPTGTVNWQASGGTGSPLSGTCGPLGTPSAGQCTFTYTPSSTGSQTLTITAYSGDSVYSPGSGTLATLALSVISPVSISPASVSIPSGNTFTFTASGGLTPYVFSISSNNSGGSINANTGVYTAGPTTQTTDTVKVVDGSGSSSTATVTITKRSTSVAIVSCAPALGAANSSSYNKVTSTYSPTTCSATVTDTTGPGATTPSGTVTWSIQSGGTGSFTGSPCTLSPTGTCLATVTFTPISAGPTVIQATYNGDATYSTNLQTATVETAPGLPASFNAQKATGSATGVKLSWNAPASNGGSAVTNYKIYRSLTPGTETLLTTVSGSTTSYNDTATISGTTYYYYVTAVNSLGEGQASPEKFAPAK